MTLPGVRPPGAPAPTWLPAARRLAILFAVYFAAGKLGLSFARIHGSISLVWPPSGIALAALLLLGVRYWPGVLLGAFMVNLTTTGSAASSLGIAIGNTLEAVAGAALVARFARGRHAFQRPRDVFKFTFLAGMLSPALAATCGVASLAATQLAHWSTFGRLWLNWWVGDAGGILVVAPCVTLWRLGSRPVWTRGRTLEAALLCLSVIVVGQGVFGGLFSFEAHRYPLTFLCLPVLLWAAFRFGPREATTATAVLSAIAVGATRQGVGPFSRLAQNETLVMLELFMCVISVTVMAIAAVVSEGKRVEASVRGAYDELGLRFERQRTDLAQAVESLRAEIKARRRAERYAEAIVETIQDPLLVLDASLRVRAANPSFYQLFRVTRESTEGRLLFELGDGQWDIPGLRRLLEAVRPNARPLAGLGVEHTIQGVGPRTLVLNALPLLQEGTPGPLILLAMRDVTDSRQALDALRVSEERFRAVVETAMDGIISTNHRGEIIFFNPAAERIFGFRQPEALGRPLTCVMPERYWDAYHRGLRRFLSEGGTRIIGRAVEVTGRRKDGAEFPLELSIASWRIGSDVCFTAIARDISERKAAERGLQALSGRLLQLRDEEQRRIARELHDSTAQKVSALALNLAILEQASDVLGPKQLRALADSCGLADECSRELRDLAALLHPPQLDMVGLASAIRWHSESFARATGIRVTLALSPRLGRMPQDIETTIFRIVQECLNNIRRHAQSPTAAILIDVDDRDVTVEVKDEGRGMPENYDGAAPGVGIHAMRGRVRQHGGRFDITSGTAGTRVHVSLPLSRTEAGEAAVSRNA